MRGFQEHGWSDSFRGVFHVEAAGLLADPLRQLGAAGALDERCNPVQRVCRAALAFPAWFRPFVDHREREAEIRGDLFGAGLLKNLAQKFV